MGTGAGKARRVRPGTWEENQIPGGLYTESPRSHQSRLCYSSPHGGKAQYPLCLEGIV
jgi:hypothetical protein